jgi:hypothetical protein
MAAIAKIKGDATSQKEAWISKACHRFLSDFGEPHIENNPRTERAFALHDMCRAIVGFGL